ncbi:MAG: hypothetical protein H0V76_08765 [Blastocatellia bacterium]|nr:hypothetical protein [Blastocatellia bacterium]
MPRGLQTKRTVRPYPRPPFWLLAPNFYVLAAAATAATFFLVWGALQDGLDEAPWIKAGVSASVVLAAAVILRELIFRDLRERIETARQLERNLRAVAPVAKRQRSTKLSLKQNAILLHQIRQKSDAAKVLGRLSAAHREVFDLCEEYLRVVHRELPGIGVGSPRLVPLQKGKTAAQGLGRFHLLKWAEIETQTLMGRAAERQNAADKLTILEEASAVLDTALARFPSEAALIESSDAVREVMTTVRVAEIVESAARASFDGEWEYALEQYRDALFAIDRQRPFGNEMKHAVEHIEAEIERITILKESGK